jgi:Domain of unknown function (DUF5925)
VPSQLLHRLDQPEVEPVVAMPLVGGIDDSDTAIDMVDLLALAPFATGRQPFARSTDLENVRADAALVPADARVVREAVDDNGQNRLAVGDGWTVRAMRTKHSAATGAPPPRTLATPVDAPPVRIRQPPRRRHGDRGQPRARGGGAAPRRRGCGGRAAASP